MQEEKYHMSLATNLFQLGDTHIIATKKVSGIYIITNKISGKIYVGESLDIYRRWHDEHIPQLRKNCHYNKELQNDFNKYGEENFSFEILERYSEDNPITTKAKIIILESYYVTAFKKSGIGLYNSENTLIEIILGNKIPQGGNATILQIIHTLSEYNIKECDGVVYFDKKHTLKSITSEYIIPNIIQEKGKGASFFVSEFKGFVKDHVDNLDCYIRKHSIQYTLNGKKIITDIEEIYEEKVQDIQYLAVLFSEHKKEEKKKADRKRKLLSDYEPIKNGEIRFSLLFKEFAENGIIPKDYIYDKVREYLVDLGIITMKNMDSNGASKRVTFVTDDALDKGILRIIGCKNYGNSVIYSYVFTVNGIEHMRKLFPSLSERKKLELFTYMNIA